MKKIETGEYGKPERYSEVTADLVGLFPPHDSGKPTANIDRFWYGMVRCHSALTATWKTCLAGKSDNRHRRENRGVGGSLESDIGAEIPLHIRFTHLTIVSHMA